MFPRWYNVDEGRLGENGNGMVGNWVGKCI